MGIFHSYVSLPEGKSNNDLNYPRLNAYRNMYGVAERIFMALWCSFWAWELMGALESKLAVQPSYFARSINWPRSVGPLLHVTTMATERTQKPVSDTPIHIKFYCFYHHDIQLILRLSSQFTIVHWLSYPNDGRTATSRTLFSPLLLLFLSMFPWLAEIPSWVKSNFWIWLNDHDSLSPFGDEPPNAMGPFKWRKTTWGHPFF